MNLEQLSRALLKTHTELGLDAIDLMLLHTVTSKLKREGEATIMPIDRKSTRLNSSHT